MPIESTRHIRLNGYIEREARIGELSVVYYLTELLKHTPISCQKAADTTLGKKNADRLY